MFGAKWSCLPDMGPYLDMATDVRKTCATLQPDDPMQVLLARGELSLSWQALKR